MTCRDSASQTPSCEKGDRVEESKTNPVQKPTSPTGGTEWEDELQATGAGPSSKDGSKPLAKWPSAGPNRPTTLPDAENKVEAEVDEAVDDSFPASDPPSSTGSHA
jgi:hypothetical protein